MSLTYPLVPRTTHKKTGDPLSGFALDITIRANKEGTYFLDDHNSDSNVMPHTNVFDLISTLVLAIGENHERHFGN